MKYLNEEYLYLVILVCFSFFFLLAQIGWNLWISVYFLSWACGLECLLVDVFGFGAVTC